jgi:pimeloyl-ACP methyl ester carboxylesterase
MSERPEVHYVRVGDISIAYSQWGSGEETVFFTPPLFSNIELMWDLPEWERLFTWAGKHFRIIIMDKRGVGLSDRTSEPATLSDYVNDVVAVLDAEGFSKVNIAGQSEGGAVGIAFASAHPNRVKKLCIIGTPALGLSRDLVGKKLLTGETLPSAEEMANIGRELVKTWGTKNSRMLEWFAPSVSGDPRIRRWWSKFERQSCSPSALLTMIRGMSEFDLSPLLSGICSPTLVCHSDGDRVAHIAEGRTLAKLIPGAVFKEWSNPNHLWGFGNFWRDHSNDLIEFFTGIRPKDSIQQIFATVLFTDMVGSTRIASELRDENWRTLLDRHNAICEARVYENAGTLIKRTGDGILATFPSPINAVNSALEIRRDLLGIEVSIRAGLHVGQIELHDTGDVSGLAVNIASRVQSLASSDEVLVSQTVKDMLIGSDFVLLCKGAHELKGIDGEWTVYTADKTPP